MRGKVVHCRRDSFDVYIGRPGPWGNPFRLGLDGDREEVIEKFRTHVLSNPEMVDRIKRELGGKVLGCWCAPLACHGDVLVEIAESMTTTEEIAGEK